MASAGEPLRIGLLGAARISAAAVVAPARITGDRLVAVAARSRARAAEFAEQHGVERVLDDYAAVCADPEVQAVYNPLANGMHGPWNLAAIRAGKHVLSEKPFASNAAEAHVVAEAARAEGVVVVEAFHYRHHPVMRRMVELARTELGPVRHVEAHFTMPPPKPADPRWSFRLAGGALMDLGCYGLHASRVLGREVAGGEPALTRAVGVEHADNPGVDETMTIELAFPSGATGLVRCSMNDGRRTTLRVFGERGEAEARHFVSPQRDDTIAVTTGGAERIERLGTRASYTYQLEAFAELLRHPARDAAASALDDAVANAELIDTVYRAAGFPLRPSTRSEHTQSEEEPSCG